MTAKDFPGSGQRKVPRYRSDGSDSYRLSAGFFLNLGGNTDKTVRPKHYMLRAFILPYKLLGLIGATGHSG